MAETITLEIHKISKLGSGVKDDELGVLFLKDKPYLLRGKEYYDLNSGNSGKIGEAYKHLSYSPNVSGSWITADKGVFERITEESELVDLSFMITGRVLDV